MPPGAVETRILTGLDGIVLRPDMAAMGAGECSGHAAREKIPSLHHVRFLLHRPLPLHSVDQARDCSSPIAASG